jgi:hypothetical protein
MRQHDMAATTSNTKPASRWRAYLLLLMLSLPTSTVAEPCASGLQPLALGTTTIIEATAGNKGSQFSIDFGEVLLTPTATLGELAVDLTPAFSTTYNVAIPTFYMPASSSLKRLVVTHAAGCLQSVPFFTFVDPLPAVAVLAATPVAAPLETAILAGLDDMACGSSIAEIQIQPSDCSVDIATIASPSRINSSAYSLPLPAIADGDYSLFVLSDNGCRYGPIPLSIRNSSSLIAVLDVTYRRDELWLHATDLPWLSYPFCTLTSPDAIYTPGTATDMLTMVPDVYPRPCAVYSPVTLTCPEGSVVFRLPCRPVTFTR